MQRTVLLADDEEMVRDVIGRLLLMLGWRVILASDSAEMLTKLETNAADISLVLLDWNMPKVTGEHAMRHVRHLAPGKPLVLMSGFAEADLAPDFQDAKPAGYLQKPFQMAALDQMLRQVLGD